MLDTILKAIMRKLDVHLEEVRDQRVKIERERASGSPRTIATAILKHPEGYATSPREAAESGQKAYAKARNDWEQNGIPMLTMLATLAIARERRDETAAILREHEKTEANRKATKVHPDFRRLNDTMIAHGVQTGHAATATPGIIAIVSDILMWAGADPDLSDPETPLRAILEVYGTRVILTPGQFGDRSKSKPGKPVRQVKYSDPEHYMFSEAAQPAVDINAGTKSAAAVKPDVFDDDNKAARMPPIVISPAQDFGVDIVTVEQPSGGVVRTTAPMPPIMSTENPGLVSGAISPEHARHIAETVFVKNPGRLGIYWPKDGCPMGDYEPARLIPALEKGIEIDPWEGWIEFLEAARQGQAHAFIENKRCKGVSYLATQLQRGDEAALNAARSAGFEVKI